MDSRCGGLRIPVGVGPVAIIPVDVRPVVVLPEFMIPDGFMQQPPLSQGENEQETMTMITKARLLFRGLPLGIADLGWLWGGACRLWGGGLFPGLAGLLLEADLFFVAHLFRGGAVVDGSRRAATHSRRGGGYRRRSGGSSPPGDSRSVCRRRHSGWSAYFSPPLFFLYHTGRRVGLPPI